MMTTVGNLKNAKRVRVAQPLVFAMCFNPLYLPNSVTKVGKAAPTQSCDGRRYFFSPLDNRIFCCDEDCAAGCTGVAEMDCLVRNEWSFVSKVHISHQHTSRVITYAHNTHMHAILHTSMYACDAHKHTAYGTQICTYCMYILYVRCTQYMQYGHVHNTPMYVHRIHACMLILS